MVKRIKAKHKTSQNARLQVQYRLILILSYVTKTIQTLINEKGIFHNLKNKRQLSSFSKTKCQSYI